MLNNYTINSYEEQDCPLAGRKQDLGQRVKILNQLMGGLLTESVNPDSQDDLVYYCRKLLETKQALGGTR